MFKNLKIKTLCLRTLRAVARAGGTALVETGRVELAAHDRVLHADVFHAATAKHHDRVFLQVVRLARDVSGYFHAVGQADAGDLTDSGVRLARGLRGHLGADAALERRGIEGRAVLKRVETAGKSRLARLRRLGGAPLL